MSKTNKPGILGEFDLSRKPAIILGKIGGGSARVRVFDDLPDDDVQRGSGGPGYTATPTPITLADAPGAGSFVAVHEHVRYLDTEADLATILLSEDDQDSRFIVRQASQLGQKSFQAIPVGPGIFAFAPLALLGPTMELATSASANESVPTATDEIFGTAGFASTFARTLRFPGHDAGSPFENFTWLYNNGVIGGIPPGRARIAITAVLSNFDAARWDIVLQNRINDPLNQPPTAWADAEILAGFDVTAGVLISAWTFSGFASVDVPPFAEWRIVMRHDNGANRNVTVERLNAVINSVGIQV